MFIKLAILIVSYLFQQYSHAEQQQQPFGFECIVPPQAVNNIAHLPYNFLVVQNEAAELINQNNDVRILLRNLNNLDNLNNFVSLPNNINLPILNVDEQTQIAIRRRAMGIRITFPNGFNQQSLAAGGYAMPLAKAIYRLLYNVNIHDLNLNLINQNFQFIQFHFLGDNPLIDLMIIAIGGQHNNGNNYALHLNTPQRASKNMKEFTWEFCTEGELVDFQGNHLPQTILARFAPHNTVIGIYSYRHLQPD